MKLIILTLLTLVVASAQADSLFCAYDSATAHRPYVDSIQSTDKHKHCTISCAVGLDCGTGQATVIGILKEIWDAMGNGNPEIADIKANLKGIKISKMTHINNIYDCKLACFGYYTK